MIKQTKHAISVFEHQENVVEEIDELLAILPKKEKVEYLEGLLFTLLNTQKQVLSIKKEIKRLSFQEHNAEVKIIENGLNTMEYYNDKYFKKTSNMGIQKVKKNECTRKYI